MDALPLKVGDDCPAHATYVDVAAVLDKSAFCIQCDLTLQCSAGVALRGMSVL